MSDELSKALNPPPHAAELPVSDKPYPFLDDASPVLCEAVKILQKSKTGRELLECAAAYGTKINTECLNASFNDETKQIFIAAGSDKNRMVITLAHELRHSQQFQNGVLLSAYADRPKDYLQSQGVIEADANVMACQVGWELQQQGIKEPMEEFKKEDRDVVSAFLKSAEKGGVENGTAHGERFTLGLTTRDCAKPTKKITSATMNAISAKPREKKKKQPFNALCPLRTILKRFANSTAKRIWTPKKHANSLKSPNKIPLPTKHIGQFIATPATL